MMLHEVLYALLPWLHHDRAGIPGVMSIQQMYL